MNCSSVSRGVLIFSLGLSICIGRTQQSALIVQVGGQRSSLAPLLRPSVFVVRLVAALDLGIRCCHLCCHLLANGRTCVLAGLPACKRRCRSISCSAGWAMRGFRRRRSTHLSVVTKKLHLRQGFGMACSSQPHLEETTSTAVAPMTSILHQRVAHPLSSSRMIRHRRRCPERRAGSPSAKSRASLQASGQAARGASPASHHPSLQSLRRRTESSLRSPGSGCLGDLVARPLHAPAS